MISRFEYTVLVKWRQLLWQAQFHRQLKISDLLDQWILNSFKDASMISWMRNIIMVSQITWTMVLTSNDALSVALFISWKMVLTIITNRNTDARIAIQYSALRLVQCFLIDLYQAYGSYHYGIYDLSINTYKRSIIIENKDYKYIATYLIEERSN